MVPPPLMVEQLCWAVDFQNLPEPNTCRCARGCWTISNCEVVIIQLSTLFKVCLFWRRRDVLTSSHCNQRIGVVLYCTKYTQCRIDVFPHGHCLVPLIENICCITYKWTKQLAVGVLGFAGFFFFLGGGREEDCRFVFLVCLFESLYFRKSKNVNKIFIYHTVGKQITNPVFMQYHIVLFNLRCVYCNGVDKATPSRLSTFMFWKKKVNGFFADTLQALA